MFEEDKEAVRQTEQLTGLEKSETDSGRGSMGISDRCTDFERKRDDEKL